MSTHSLIEDNTSAEVSTHNQDSNMLRRDLQKQASSPPVRQDDLARERASLRAAAAINVGNPAAMPAVSSAHTDSRIVKDRKPLPIADHFFFSEYLLLRTEEYEESLTDSLRALVFPHKKPNDEEVGAFCIQLTQRLIEQKKALALADTKLSERSDNSFVRLISEEHEAFSSGIRATGRAQRESYKDALGLVQGITETPSGRRHFGAWFRQGWLLWKTDAPLGEVETAFYQAARLSAADTEGAVYHDLAARHLAEVQMALGQFSDAHETMTAALSAFPQDPTILRSCARAAALAGDTRDAFRLVEQCLGRQPFIATLLLDDPFLTDQRSAAVETLQRLRQAADQRHSTTRERWQKALDLVRRAESMAEVALPIPAHLTEGGAGDENEDEDTRAARVLDSADTDLVQMVKNAADVEFRQKRYIEKLFSDRATWQQSLEGLKNEAKAMNLNLAAPPPKKGLFGKKKEGHENVFLNYHTCRQTLVTIETEIRDHLPQLKAKLEELAKRRELLETTLALLRKNGASVR